jgi:hypothetical protein
LIVYDKLARPLVNHVLLPVPTAITKGVLISPTVYGMFCRSLRKTYPTKRDQHQWQWLRCWLKGQGDPAADLMR